MKLMHSTAEPCISALHFESFAVRRGFILIRRTWWPLWQYSYHQPIGNQRSLIYHTHIKRGRWVFYAIINFGGCRDCRQGLGDNTSCEILVASSFVHPRVRLQITPPNFRTNPPESRFRERVERERERERRWSRE
jgi:hypothetical protein